MFDVGGLVMPVVEKHGVRKERANRNQRMLAKFRFFTQSWSEAMCDCCRLCISKSRVGVSENGTAGTSSKCCPQSLPSCIPISLQPGKILTSQNMVTKMFQVTTGALRLVCPGTIHAACVLVRPTPMQTRRTVSSSPRKVSTPFLVHNGLQGGSRRRRDAKAIPAAAKGAC